MYLDIINHDKFMYEKNLKMFSFKINSSHLDTFLHFKIIADYFQQLPVGYLVYPINSCN